MIKDSKMWQKWEAEWQKSRPADFEENIKVFEELINIAREMNKWPPKDPLEGIEVDLRIAKAINTYVEKSSG